MPSTTSTQKSTSTATTRGATDAIALLKNDHKEVKTLFKTFEKLHKADGPAEERSSLATEICRKLTAHATIEEEIFYPTVRAAGVDADLLDEAEVEHASAKELIAQIESMDPDDALYDAKVTVLGEYVNHHVAEEEDELFPKVRKAKLDLKSLGEELQSRKDVLVGQMTH
jgi:hemerythrin superfamily protein